MEKFRIEPAEQRVVVLPREEQEMKTASGIILPAGTEEQKPGIGVVVEVGTGSKEEPMKYYPGETVVYSQYSGLEVKINLAEHGDNYYKIMNQLDIIGKLKTVEI